MSDDWRSAIEHQREQKDSYFADDPRSPIPQDEPFDGLSYFPIDEDYRFVVPLETYDDPETVIVGTSTDGEQEYHRWGEFRVTIDDEDVPVQAYKSDPSDDRLWVPFRDETSGQETYGAGRYLDLEPDTHRRADGWVLDFNEAYNPTCAYSDRYECPLPPTENWLGVAVRAGEKDYE
ncbi:hypothetical protein SAMN06269185_0362 [Natronoarchaeum philippinense]|uniref:DUF1684 domain-containing protein n=1 Tax=Natronoarchaeum philippinense TaxID=558529 RepID=A0A285N711_NATPI|nr:DUF1684 domain-containing protein [Natronoarchaeum philippinense]SNZ03756.1 hypothetical protein SAMN06269185_0362 [Natronoarchaeum philippinense]